MSVKTAIQNKILGALKNGEYPVITYTSEGYSEHTMYEGTPNVVCNDINAEFNQVPGANNVYAIFNWQFEALMKFNQEVDVSERLLDLNLSFTHEQYAVIVGLQSYCVLDQPPAQGSHNGTQVKIVFVANVRK